MPALFLQIVTVVTDFGIFIFLGYYLLRVREKEKRLEKKENKVDSSYHEIVDDALSHERKILEDAAYEADQIVTNAKYVSEDTKEAVNQTLQNIVLDIQKEAVNTAGTFMTSYSDSLKKLVEQSISEFSKTTKELEEDLQKQTKEFHETMLPGLEKELEEYKKIRLKQTEEIVVRVVQKVSQEVLNKSISLSDHQNLMIQSLEKAKKEGIFE